MGDAIWLVGASVFISVGVVLAAIGLRYRNRRQTRLWNRLMAEHPVRSLHHIQRRMEAILAEMRHNLEQRDLTAVAVNFTAMDAAIAALQTAASAVESDLSGDTAATAAAVAAAEAAAQAGVDQRTATIQSVTTGLTGAEPAPTPTPTPPPATTFTVTPDPADFSAGVASSVTLQASAGVEPFTASGLPTGVTFNGAALVADTTTVAGTSTVTLTDGSTPPLTGTVQVVIS